MVPGQPVSVPDPSIAEWFNTAAFVAPAGAFGDARRNSIEGPGQRLFDMAFTKIFPISESRFLEFRAQFSNIFNTPQYSAIDTVVNSPTLRPGDFGGSDAVPATDREVPLLAMRIQEQSDELGDTTRELG